MFVIYWFHKQQYAYKVINIGDKMEALPNIYSSVDLLTVNFDYEKKCKESHIHEFIENYLLSMKIKLQYDGGSDLRGKVIENLPKIMEEASGLTTKPFKNEGFVSLIDLFISHDTLDDATKIALLINDLELKQKILDDIEHIQIIKELKSNVLYRKAASIARLLNNPDLRIDQLDKIEKLLNFFDNYQTV